MFPRAVAYGRFLLQRPSHQAQVLCKETAFSENLNTPTESILNCKSRPSKPGSELPFNKTTQTLRSCSTLQEQGRTKTPYAMVPEHWPLVRNTSERCSSMVNHFLMGTHAPDLSRTKGPQDITWNEEPIHNSRTRLLQDTPVLGARPGLPKPLWVRLPSPAKDLARRLRLQCSMKATSSCIGE